MSSATARPNKYNLERTCRCCLRDLGRLTPLDKPDEKLDASTIGEAFMELANVQFNSLDGLPQKVCQKCIVALRPAFAFRKMCRENDAKLRGSFEKQTTNSVCAYEVHFVDVDGFKVESKLEVDTELVPIDERMVFQKKSPYVAVSDDEHKMRPNDILVDFDRTHSDWKQSASLTDEKPPPQPLLCRAPEPNAELSLKSTAKLKLYNCNLCPNLKNYTNLVSYEKHMAKHNRAKPFGCDICKRQFTMKRNLLYHMESHQPDKYRQLCSLCGKDFSNWFKFNSHMRSVHSGERPFKCDVCDSTFNHKNGLTRHKKRHLAVKPFGCSYCDKTFITTEKLDRHVRIHTGERPFVCAHCGKSFYADTNYKAHLRIHTGERPYRCHNCGETFSQSQQLLKHRRKFDHFEKTAALSQTD